MSEGPAAIKWPVCRMGVGVGRTLPKPRQFELASGGAVSDVGVSL